LKGKKEEDIIAIIPIEITKTEDKKCQKCKIPIIKLFDKMRQNKKPI
jgi:hypothetical protein